MIIWRQFLKHAEPSITESWGGITSSPKESFLKLILEVLNPFYFSKFQVMNDNNNPDVNFYSDKKRSNSP